MTVIEVSREEYRTLARWALLRLLDWETGRLTIRKMSQGLHEPADPGIMDLIRRDADAQVRGQ